MDPNEEESRLLLQQIRSRISTFLTPEVRTLANLPAPRSTQMALPPTPVPFGNLRAENERLREEVEALRQEAAGGGGFGGATPMHKRARTTTPGGGAAAAAATPSSMAAWEESRHQEEMREKDRQLRLAETKWSSERRELERAVSGRPPPTGPPTGNAHQQRPPATPTSNTHAPHLFP